MNKESLRVETSYVTSTQTVSGQTTKDDQVETEQVKVEIEKYGNGKPRRIITRVRITHGKGPNKN